MSLLNLLQKKIKLHSNVKASFTLLFALMGKYTLKQLLSYELSL